MHTPRVNHIQSAVRTEVVYIHYIHEILHLIVWNYDSIAILLFFNVAILRGNINRRGSIERHIRERERERGNNTMSSKVRHPYFARLATFDFYSIRIPFYFISKKNPCTKIQNIIHQLAQLSKRATHANIAQKKRISRKNETMRASFPLSLSRDNLVLTRSARLQQRVYEFWPRSFFPSSHCSTVYCRMPWELLMHFVLCEREREREPGPRAREIHPRGSGR